MTIAGDIDCHYIVLSRLYSPGLQIVPIVLGDPDDSTLYPIPKVSRYFCRYYTCGKTFYDSHFLSVCSAMYDNSYIQAFQQWM